MLLCEEMYITVTVTTILILSPLCSVNFDAHPSVIGWSEVNRSEQKALDFRVNQ